MASTKSSRVNPKYNEEVPGRELAGVRTRAARPRRRHHLVRRGRPQYVDAASYDTRSVYTAVGAAGGPGVAVVVPPRRAATVAPQATAPWAQRNQHIERIAEIGRQAWQKETGYRQQARVEGTFLRYKRILGGRLRAKGFEAQKREAMVGCAVLNKMLALGEAQSSAVAE